MELSLRGYQGEALDAVDAELAKGILRTAVVLPTGMGKTVVFSHLIGREHAKGRKTLVLVHRDELAEQAKQKIRSVAPSASVGIVKAERNEIHADVIVASVQTLARPARREQITNVGIVIVDECHHAVARTWTEVLTHFGCFDHDVEFRKGPDAIFVGTPAIGFTATMHREDGKGLGSVWQTVAYEKEILWGIENGYLVDVRGQAVEVDGLDLATIARSRGDYQEGALGEALEASGAGEIIAQAYLEHAAGRRGVLFAPTVATAYSFAQSLRDAGLTAETIVGETPKEDRELIYKRYNAGEIDILTNAMVLTEGWDSPATSCAIIARPTQSAALYTQMVGRILRPFPGKDDALVLDVVGVTGRHRLRSLTDLSKVEVRDGETLVEAQERVATEQRDRMEKVRIEGTRKSREVELFSASHAVWLKTYAGIDFIPVRDGLIVLWGDEDGTYRVGVKNKGRKGEWVLRGIDFEYALAWGEQIANERDATVADKNRAWRRAKPSQAQLDLALKLFPAKVDEIVNMRKGALSDRISIHFASRELDPRR